MTYVASSFFEWKSRRTVLGVLHRHVVLFLHTNKKTLYSPSSCRQLRAVYYCYTPHTHTLLPFAQLVLRARHAMLRDSHDARLVFRLRQYVRECERLLSMFILLSPFRSQCVEPFTPSHPHVHHEFIQPLFFFFCFPWTDRAARRRRRMPRKRESELWCSARGRAAC